jgi:hypothetical protein
MQQLIDEFQVRGFVVLNNTLSSEQVSTLNRAVDSYLERFPWAKSGSSSYQAGAVLPRTSDFDLAIESPITLSFGRAFLGEAITFEHLSIVIRSPEPNPTEPKGWPGTTHATMIGAKRSARSRSSTTCLWRIATLRYNFSRLAFLLGCRDARSRHPFRPCHRYFCPTLGSGRHPFCGRRVRSS